jgi:uncharacterized Zn finger protein (UPF0148 family)
MAHPVRLYGGRCSRCGCTLIMTDGDDGVCATCAADERARDEMMEA